MFVFESDKNSLFLGHGLVDQLKGMCSIYFFEKKRQIPFRINYVEPFNLTFFLQPNLYDWCVSEEEISYNCRTSKAIALRVNKIKFYLHKAMLYYYSKRYSQVHLYTIAMLFDNYFKQNFNELFKPSPFLIDSIDHQLCAIGGDYVSATFRFQALLGDFYEGELYLFGIKS